MKLFKDETHDGADYQAQAVLAYLRARNIEESWDGNQYTAQPTITRWINGREQGYIIILTNNDKQLNIIFYEHRNSDDICAVKWEQEITYNPPNIDSAKFGDAYKDKYDVSFQSEYGKILPMVDWIHNELVDYYKKSKK